MDVSTLELRAKSQNWKKKEKSSVHKQLVDDGWKTTEIHTLYETFGGFGCKFFPSVASTADAFLSKLLRMRTMPSWVKWFQFEDFSGLGCKFFPFCCHYC